MTKQQKIKAEKARVAEEARRDSLAAMGFIACPRCHQFADPRGFQIFPHLRYYNDRPICADCQPVKLVEGIGWILRDTFGNGEHTGYCYIRHDSDFDQGGYATVAEAEARLRAHVADLEDRPEIIENPEDLRDYHSNRQWRDKIVRVMRLHDNNRDAADFILSGRTVCAEHHYCRNLFKHAA